MKKYTVSITLEATVEASSEGAALARTVRESLTDYGAQIIAHSYAYGSLKNKPTPTADSEVSL